MVLTLVSTLLLVLPSVLSGGIFESIDDLPSDVTYDFLIVGGQFHSSQKKNNLSSILRKC